MYTFIDTTEMPKSGELPTEALQLNGDYLENLIEGYRTLTVQGREALSGEVSTETAGLRPGTVYVSRKYPERVITVKYQLSCRSAEAFREAYNKLASILDLEEARLIFADEPDKYFIGTPGVLEEVEPGKNTVVSTIQFVCADPFKYSVQEYEAELLQDGTLYCDYHGTFPAHPKLTAQFLKEGDVTEEGEASTITGDGDCGYIARAELRWLIPLKKQDQQLQLAAYFDHGGIRINKDKNSGGDLNYRHLEGAGIGLIWSRWEDWFIRLDYAWRVGHERPLSDTSHPNGHFWVRGGVYF